MLAVNRIHNMDCLDGMKLLPDNCCDCCVTDPPWGIKFMGSKWDYEIPAVEAWREVWRVLKPGAHLLCACGTRTQHRMAVNIEDAGFGIRDVICWHYGQGFSKSLDISKAMDRQAGSERKIIGHVSRPGKEAGRYGVFAGNNAVSIPESNEAKQWGGWGTALKPATEFFTLARKPLEEKTVAENVVRFGTGGLNIDASRIELSEGDDSRLGGKGSWASEGMAKNAYGDYVGERVHSSPLGRFPANLILDEFAAREMDEQSGILTSGQPVGKRKAQNKIYGAYATGQDITGYGDSGGASRFFYIAKADAVERGRGNNHPTVKPLTLMSYLVKLICPIESGKIVLEPFAGSGTTCIAARQLGVDFMAFELSAEYVGIAENRLRDALGLFYEG
jgi:DNA modification methylase